MLEPGTHNFLVAKLLEDMRARFSPIDDLCILVDDASSPVDHRPPLIGGKRPDIYIRSVGSQRVTALGEAKTAHDIENPHTLIQLAQYIQFLRHTPSAHLILAVPWHQTRLVNSLTKKLQRDQGADTVEIVVLSDLPG